jgi:arabinogalactan oligomer/maltooligosaccharide transport system substrate-binding protein
LNSQTTYSAIHKVRFRAKRNGAHQIGGKIMKKKLIKVTAISLALLLLSACGSNPDAASSPDADSSSGSDRALPDNVIEEDGLYWDPAAEMYLLEEEVLNGSAVLKLWHNEESFTDAIVAGFTQKYPGVQVEVQTVLPQDNVDKISLEGEAGTGADVFFIPHDHAGRAYGNSVLGMMGRYEDAISERFLESAVNTVNIDGNLYGIPLNTESIALYYNKTLLQQLYEQGLVDSPEPATEWSQIVALAEQYNHVHMNRWTIRWQVEDSYYDYMFMTPFGYELFGPNRNDPDLINYDTPEAKKGLEFLVSLRPTWNINSGDANWDTTTVEFAKGETPYLISGPWSMEMVRKGGADNGYEFGVTTIPLVSGVQPYTFSGVNLVCVSPYSQYPAAARALAMYITSDEMLQFMYENNGKIPALNDEYAGNIRGLKDDMDVRGFLAQAEFSHAMPTISEMSFYWSTAKTMYMSVWDGVVTVDEAVKAATEEYNMLRTIE